MTLKYRGTQYRPVSGCTEVKEGSVMGHYRGVEWKSHVCSVPQVKSQHSPLKYRGVSF